MNVQDDIRLHAADSDKPCLDWLFGRYHMASQWSFVAQSSFKRYGVQSYQVHRVWVPTPEGRVLYESGKL